MPRWTCPKCGSTKLAPTRPRMDDVRRWRKAIQRRLGYADFRKHTIALAVTDATVKTRVLDTLLHEVAHFVVGNVKGRFHGDVFRSAFYSAREEWNRKHPELRLGPPPSNEDDEEPSTRKKTRSVSMPEKTSTMLTARFSSTPGAISIARARVAHRYLRIHRFIIQSKYDYLSPKRGNP